MILGYYSLQGISQVVFDELPSVIPVNLILQKKSDYTSETHRFDAVRQAIPE